MTEDKFKIAAVQATPVFMNRDATVEKACLLIEEAAANGARLVFFPEAFIPTYPDWIWFVPAGRIALNQKLYGALLDQAVAIPGETTERLCQAAREAGVFVSMGINERNDNASGGTIYNTNILINTEGDLIDRHQKLVPTVSERTIWAYGDPGTLAVHQTDIGKIGGLICHENYMPLVRYSLYGRGIELYLAPTYDESEMWQSTIRHIAREGRVYAAGCCMVLKKEAILERFSELAPFYEAAGEWINSGNSVIADPEGNIVAGPLSQAEGILYADVDLEHVRSTRWNLDVAGHYSRPDAFQLTVRTAPAPILRVESGAGLPHEDALKEELFNEDGDSGQKSIFL